MITVIGGGPAGASAAIAACRAGAADVRVFEKSPFPRHKVCGEFFSPGILTLMDQLGLAADFQAAGPHRYRYVDLHFPRTHRRIRLPEDGWGLSRLAFDQMLLDAARRAGARVRQEKVDLSIDGGAVVEARGRRCHAARGARLFGFKAHFAGPVDDAVSLYFWDSSCYVGVNAVEGGAINVCGLAPEDLLKARGFHPEDLAAGFAPLQSRLGGLERQSAWMFTGPLLFDSRLRQPPPSPRTYWAGDQLSFVDPFTGSGMLAAVFTGRRAGLSAAAGEDGAAYLRVASASLGGPRQTSGLVRWAVRSGLAETLLHLTPESWLFHWTRPVLKASGR